jgi:putative Mg2+ transporter-C (MgtC) family protein
MPLTPTWPDIAVRLALTMLAGAILGLDRGARGHAAGLRTTILVALAAAVAMVQANILLPVGGKTPASFSVLDLMRLPLGILTGVGFIGGGAILKRGDIVRGVTTAATLWIATVIGLCFGGGQLGLGLPRQHKARLVIETGKGARITEVSEALMPMHCRAHFLRQVGGPDAGRVQLGYEIAWRQAEVDGAPAQLIDLINARFELVSFDLVSESPP